MGECLGLPKAGNRLVVLAEPGMYEGQHILRKSQIHRVARLGSHLQSLPRIVAGPLEVTQVSVAARQASQRPPRAFLVAGLVKERQGLIR